MNNTAYVTGPLFSQAERDFYDKLICVCADSGYKVLQSITRWEQHVEGFDNKIFTENLHSIEEADLIVANLDGPDVDANTAWEIGYAVARGKSIIGIRTDRRGTPTRLSRVNVMTEQSTFIVNTLEALKTALLASKS